MQTSWESLSEEVAHCSRCPLAAGRRNTLLGEGHPHARLMLIGEGPGDQEDRTGRPFVGPAGQLLDRILRAIGLDRSDVYICNVVKCRPPNNRVPEIEERTACLGYLRQQAALVRPRIIVLLGSTAARTVLDPDIRITRSRGVWHFQKGVWILPTYHPSALLRDPEKKRPVWEDFKAIREKMGELGLLQTNVDRSK